MKHFFLVLLTILIFTSQAFADVIHLKDGSTISGTIVEHVPGAKIRILAKDGTALTYHMEDVVKITRAAPVAQDSVRVVPVDFQSVKRKRPLLAFGLSLLVPGTGQLYNGDYGHGVVHLLAAGFAWDNYSTTDSTLTLVCCLTIHLISAIDAPIKARRINKRRFQFGHLIEVPGDRITLGIDPITSREKLGTMLSLRF